MNQRTQNICWLFVAISLVESVVWSASKPSAPVTQNSATLRKENAASLAISSRYVGNWIKMPSLRAVGLDGATEMEFKPKAQRVAIVVFLSSWCVPCQKIIPEIVKLEKKYKELPADFYYVFAHDYVKNANGFAREFGVDVSKSILDSDQILKDYHDPKPPSVYLSDRHEMLTDRFIDMKPSEVASLNRYLELLTGI